ncbi:MAG: type II secretion system F family protein [Sulfuricella sp.]|nr:type II secretion system F family protein [Sulfuricella sp.]
MAITQLIFLAVVFLAVTLVAMVVLLQLNPSKVKGRLSVLKGSGGGQDSRSAWIETIVKLSRPVANLSLPADGWENSASRIRFMNAGYRSATPIALYFAAKTLLALLLPIALFLYTAVTGADLGTQNSLIALLGAAAAGFYLPNLLLARRVAHRQLDIFENFPDATDLILVCIEAGLGLDAAIGRVAGEIRLKSQVLSDELHLVTLELRAGSSRERALRNLALRTGVEEVDTLVAMLIQADRFGTSVGDSLRVYADDLRTKRRQRAEEKAAKIPLTLLFPLVLFIFPSLLLVLLGPAFIQVYRVLLPALSSQ